MSTFIALLRAVNVGGTGKLPMSDLAALCAQVGFERVRTYIASGNVVFDDDGSDALDKVTGRADEELRLGRREIYVHYGQGMGTSKLKIPAAKAGTARNMNTVAKLVEMAAEN